MYSCDTFHDLIKFLTQKHWYSNGFNEGARVSIFGVRRKEGFCAGKFRRYQILLSATVSANLLLGFSTEAGEHDLSPRIPFRIAPCLSIPRYGQDTWFPSSIICPPSGFPCNQNTSPDRQPVRAEEMFGFFLFSLSNSSAAFYFSYTKAIILHSVLQFLRFAYIQGMTKQNLLLEIF